MQQGWGQGPIPGTPRRRHSLTSEKASAAANTQPGLEVSCALTLTARGVPAAGHTALVAGWPSTSYVRVAPARVAQHESASCTVAPALAHTGRLLQTKLGAAAGQPAVLSAAHMKMVACVAVD